MQETKYGIRQVQEDYRWMVGEADLGNVLAPFSASAAAPLSLESASQPQPQLALRSALLTLSVDINALAQEQVRLRETLETLNSTLFINGDSLSPKTADVTTSVLKDEVKTPADGVLMSGTKAVVGELLDALKSKLAEKTVDWVFDRVGKKFKTYRENGSGGTPPGPGSDSAGNAAGGPGAPAQGVQSFAGARSLAPAPNLPGVPVSALNGALAKLESTGARRLGPLKYADTAVDLIQGVRNGDANAIGSGLSTAGGAWAGAYAGAAIGTLVLPGVGTAVGGAIGGLLGSEAGAWLGDKLFGSSERLPEPGAVGKELNSARTDSVQVTLAPSIQISGVNPADSQQVVNQVIQALKFQCMPMVTDVLGSRRNAALADPPGGD